MSAPLLDRVTYAPPAVAESGGLLDAILAATPARRGAAPSPVAEFLREPSAAKAAALWLGLPAGRTAPPKADVARRLNADLAHIDELLSRQVNAILHHPQFQKLEASWRGLRYLVESVPEEARVKVRLLNVTWQELDDDLNGAIDFDQSETFRKIYGEGLDMPGADPFGLWLGDYEIAHKPAAQVRTLAHVSEVAAAAFAPFVAAAHPSLLGFSDFAELHKPRSLADYLAATFQDHEYAKWNELRKKEDARFVGLTVPRVLMRPPYADDGSRVDGFRFREDVAGPDQSNYLWGNAAYAFAAVVVRAFARSGWLARIRGVPENGDGGGLVTGLPAPCFDTDRPGLVPRCPTEVIVTDEQEGELEDVGLIPLCHLHDTDRAAFFGNPSLQVPEVYDRPEATAGARLSAMLQYILCASRFAHYLKVIGRERVGLFADAGGLERYLSDWLRGYTNKGGGNERFPLQEAGAEVTQQGGHFYCALRLRPHFQLDQVAAAVNLRTELGPVPRT